MWDAEWSEFCDELDADAEELVLITFERLGRI